MVQCPVKKPKGAQVLDKSRRKPERKKTASGHGTKHGKITKKLTSQGINNIERIMAARAGATGKLTIMKRAATEGMQAAAALRKGGRQKDQAPRRNSAPAGGHKRKK